MISHNSLSFTPNFQQVIKINTSISARDIIFLEKKISKCVLTSWFWQELAAARSSSLAAVS
jgi:hypothetical protein